MSDYRELEVWKLGRVLAGEVYRLTATLPESEKFGLRSQMQRAAISVPANIAEGAGRQSDPAFGHFVRIAIGSLNELETLLLISADVGLTDESSFVKLQKDMKDLSIKLRNLAAKLESATKK